MNHALLAVLHQTALFQRLIIEIVQAGLVGGTGDGRRPLTFHNDRGQGFGIRGLLAGGPVTLQVGRCKTFVGSGGEPSRFFPRRLS